MDVISTAVMAIWLKAAAPAFGPVDNLHCEAKCPAPIWQCDHQISFGDGWSSWSCNFPKTEKEMHKEIKMHRKYDERLRKDSLKGTMLWRLKEMSGAQDDKEALWALRELVK